MTTPPRHDVLKARRLGVDTYREPVIFLHEDCPVCRAEGFQAMSRIQVTLGTRHVIATLNVVRGDLLDRFEGGLSEVAWLALGANDGEILKVSHPEPVDSFSAVRGKIYGVHFTDAAMHNVVNDIAEGHYSSIQIAAFITACAGNSMSLAETLSMTRAMISAGTRMSWNQSVVLDKHCIGGLPGNRTTPIVVAIIAACGLTIPKTSSRAITSPAGTADVMETMAPVELTLRHMRRVVEREGGCVIWGGAMALSPVDDILIQVERPLDFDSAGQLASSVLSKKVAAGARQLIIDLPIGPTAKIRDSLSAQALTERLEAVGRAIGMEVRVIPTDGKQPVGYGVGPALEALDVLAVLQRLPDAPADLRDRSLTLAGHLIDLSGRAATGKGREIASLTLDSGEAWKKFQAICEAQGGMRTPPVSAYQRDILARHSGWVASIDNRRLSRIAKLAGAPLSPAAGLKMTTRIGQRIEHGQALYTLHAQSTGELEYAAAYASSHPEIIDLRDHA